MGASPDDGKDNEIEPYALDAIAGYEIVIYVYEGVQYWAAGTSAAVVVGEGFPPGAAIVAAGASESTVASAIATVTANPGTVASVSILGTETTVAGGGAAGVGGSTLIGAIGTTAGVVAVAFVIAAATVIAIDCATHDECIWTAVNNAGGLGVVLGTSPNPAAAPSPNRVTVSCNPAAGSLTSQCQRALSNMITQYYSWFGGSYWTCGDMWASSGSSSLWNQEMASCNALVNSCIAQTNQVCGGGGLLPQPVAVDAQ